MRRHIALVVAMFSVLATTAHAQDFQQQASAALQPLSRMLQAAPTATSAQASRLDSVWTYDHYFGTGYVPATTVVYGYDHQLLLSEHRYAWTNWVRNPESRTSHVYDGAGRLTSSTYHEWDVDANGFVPHSRSEYSYVNSNPLASEIIERVWSAEHSGFQPFARQTFDLATTEGVMHVTAGISYDFEDGGWEPTDRFYLEQEDASVRYVMEVWEGGAWVPDVRQTFLNTTVRELYERMERIAAEMERMHGSLLAFEMPDNVQEVWNGTDWQVDMRLTTTRYYDMMTGLILRSEALTESWDEDEDGWLPAMRLVIENEVVGQTARADTLRFQLPMGEDEWFTMLREYYAYDERGRLIDIDTDMMDWLGDLMPSGWTRLFWSDTVTSIDTPELPLAIELAPAYPNPFNPSTTLTFDLLAASDVTLAAFDMLGRRVATLAAGQFPAGRHEVSFDASSLPSGTYLVRLDAAGQVRSRAVTLMK